MRLPFTGLWRHSDFVKLWTGQTISMFGSRISFLALPLTAVLVLEATPAQMGLLTAANSLPSLLLGLFVGVWVDHYRRRPILIAADVGRGLLLLIIPLAAVFGILHLQLLYLIAFLVGTLGLFFDVAYRSFLPTLVETDQLVEGNSKLEMSRSVAEIAGPGVAGGLIQLVTAPIAIAVDALSFFVSVLFLGLMRTPESKPEPPAQQQNVWQEIGAGLKFVAHNRLLRAIAGCIGMLSLFNSIIEAVSILYMARNLDIDPGLLGVIYAGGSVGFLLGTFLPNWITRRFGLKTGIIGGVLLVGGSDLLILLLDRSMAMIIIILVLMTAQFCFGLGFIVFNIGQVSLRQAVTPVHLQGRMNATMHFITWGIVPVGSLLGGWLGETIGLRSTLFLAALGELLAAGWLFLSPVWAWREQSQQ